VRRLRWVIPILLAGGVVAGTVAAWRLEAAVPDRAPTAVGAGDHAITPILSVRRVPSLLATPIAERRLYADLDALVGLLPPDSCLVVEGPDLRFAHRASVPLVPASTTKLLTATVALEARATGLGDEGLVDVVGQMLRESDDRAAELVLAGVGGATTAEALLSDGSIDLAGVTLVDGSGHSLDNRVTCAALVDVLDRPTTGAVLQALLAVAGETGTLADRFVGTPLEGILRAKTGSLTSVSGLAGVVVDDDPPLTFALIVNMPPTVPIPDGVADVQQQFGERLAAWTLVPDASRLGPVVDDG
jgi:hypothetical protein